MFTKIIMTENNITVAAQKQQISQLHAQNFLTMWAPILSRRLLTSPCYSSLENTKSDGSSVHFDAILISRGWVLYIALSSQSVWCQMKGL